MRALIQCFKVWEEFDCATMRLRNWDLFVKSLALALFAYWLHLSAGVDDWLGSEGFHLISPATVAFPPLPLPFPRLLWWITLGGIFLMFSRRTTAWGSLLGGLGFFYATMCDPPSMGALNMHFLFALAIIFWSTGLRKSTDRTMSAWPAYLIRIYLIIVYFGSGWRKAIYGDWLSNPNALFHCMMGYFTTNTTRWLYPVVPSFIWQLIQYVTVGFELGAPLLLLYPPLRKKGVLLGCLLHLGIALLMKDLFYFSFQMLTFYIPVLIPTSHLTAASDKRGHQSAT